MTTALKDNVTTLKEGVTLEEGGVKDIYVAAYLAALGYKLEMARSSSYQSEFYFKNVESADVLKYYNGEPHPKLSARKLFDSFQNMRRVSRQVRAVPGQGVSPQGATDDDEEA